MTRLFELAYTAFSGSAAIAGSRVLDYRRGRLDSHRAQLIHLSTAGFLHGSGGSEI